MIDTELKEAELLLEAYGWCSDLDRADKILSHVKSIIAPFVKIRNPRALWLKSTMPNLGEEQPISDDELDKFSITLIKESSDGKCAEAQYRYACHLYEKNEYNKAIELYEQSAIQGYAPAQWCFGIDTLNGVGGSIDEKVGLHYIRLSAEQKYEYAIEFMIRNCKEGKFGFHSDESEVKKWELILLQAD